ncbi:hypothetical protein ASE55_11740 [Chryseobacterium sp. Leaf201]|nr:hypothetical protein ASE55_11740 [Chryseobacterium sp. Leaf201]
MSFGTDLIQVDGLFLDFTAGFDAEKLGLKTLELEITANIPHNKRNSNTDNDYSFDHQLYKERYAIERTNA